MVLPKFRWPMWANQRNQLINVPAFPQPAPLNIAHAAPPQAQVHSPNDGNPSTRSTIDTASQTDHYNNENDGAAAYLTSSGAEGVQRQPDTSPTATAACITCDQVKAFLQNIVALVEADQAISSTFAKLISSIQLDNALFESQCQSLKITPAWINLSNHEVERSFKMVWAVCSSISVQPAYTKELASGADSTEEMASNKAPISRDESHTNNSNQPEDGSAPTPQTALEQYLDANGKTQLQEAVTRICEVIGFPSAYSTLIEPAERVNELKIQRVLSNCKCSSTECRAFWLISARAIASYALTIKILQNYENINEEKDLKTTLLESAMSIKDLKIQDLLTTKAEYKAKAEAVVPSIKPNTEPMSPLEQLRGLLDPLTRPLLLHAKQEMAARIRDIIQKVPPKSWIKSPESQLQTEHSMQEDCLAMCGCEKLSCRAVYLVLSDFVSMQVQADMLYKQEVLDNVARHKAAEELATKLHSDIERNQKAITAVRTQAIKNKKMATEAQEVANTTRQNLRDLEAELQNPETANAKKWEISKWKNEAMNAIALRAANERLREDVREVQSLRDTHENLQELAGQTPMLQTEVADLQAKITSIKANNKVETERLRKEVKMLRNSDEGQLSQELHESNIQNKALSDKIRQLQDQLAIASSTPTPPTLPEPPTSTTGSLSSINFDAFQINNNANRTYEGESSRLLEYFRTQSIELASRANGITDQGAGGWSAYEQLEKVVITLAPHNAAAVANVFELRPDLERNERLNTMGFVPFDAAKKGKKKTNVRDL